MPSWCCVRLVALAVTLACNGSAWYDLEVPTDPYYLYNGQRIYLTYNTGRLTVEADSALVPQLPADAGVAVDSVTSWYVAPKHWVLWLSHGISRGAVYHAALKLRQTPGVTFASNAYDTRPDQYPGTGQCTLMLDNALGVKFKSGVTTSQINEFIQEMGTTGRPDVYTPGLWIVRYPVGSATPPLQVGVDVSANPLVDWADSDRTETGCPELF